MNLFSSSKFWGAVGICFLVSSLSGLSFIALLAVVGLLAGLYRLYGRYRSSKMWRAALVAFPKARVALGEGKLETMWANLDLTFRGFSVDRHYGSEQCSFIVSVLEFSRKAAPEVLGPTCWSDLDILETHVRRGAAADGLELSSKIRGSASMYLEQVRHAYYLGEGRASLSREDRDNSEAIQLLLLALHDPPTYVEGASKDEKIIRQSFAINLESLCHILDQCPELLTHPGLQSELRLGLRRLVQGYLDPSKGLKSGGLGALECFPKLAKYFSEDPRVTGKHPRAIDFDVLAGSREEALRRLLNGDRRCEIRSDLEKSGAHPILAWTVTELVAGVHLPFLRYQEQNSVDPRAAECDICHDSIEKLEKKFYRGTWLAERADSFRVITSFAGLSVTKTSTLECTYALCRPCYKKARPFSTLERTGRAVLAFVFVLLLAFGGTLLWEKFASALPHEHLGYVLASASILGFVPATILWLDLGSRYTGYPKSEDDGFALRTLRSL